MPMIGGAVPGLARRGRCQRALLPDLERLVPRRRDGRFGLRAAKHEIGTGAVGSHLVRDEQPAQDARDLGPVGRLLPSL